MDDATQWEDRTVAVVGLGRTGRAAVRLLRGLGSRVKATDDAPAGLPAEVAAEMEDLGAPFVPPGGREELWAGTDLCITSPGVPWKAPVLQEARRRRIPVLSELELASRFVRGTVLAITGTNGKSTTTALAAHLLTACGRSAPAGGNLGTPLSEMLQGDGPEVHHVVECSSFQLMGCTTFRPRVAVLLNISPDHLDWHDSMEEYVAAKERIFQAQRAGDVAVYNGDDPVVVETARGARCARTSFHHSRPSGGGDISFWREGGALWTDMEGEGRAWCPEAEIPLLGPHNLENVMAAAAAAGALGCPLDRVREALPSFRALPHRMQRVSEAGGILFVDDSKATNVEAARRAVLSFPGALHLILGGRDKGGDWAGLRPDLEGRARGLYLVGEATDLIAGALEGVAATRRFALLEEAVEAAWQEARPGEVVLLAPGCASQDMFRDYVERGERFAAAVGRLTAAGDPPGGRGGRR